MLCTAILVCLLTGCSAAGSPARAAEDKRDAQVASEKKAIFHHKWWAKRPLPEKTFEALIREVTEHNEGMVFVNNETKFVWVKSVKGDPRGGPRVIHAAAEKQYPKVKALGPKRIVLVVVPRTKQRNARMEAIFHLIDALDAGGYEQFAPKKEERPKTKKSGPKK